MDEEKAQRLWVSNRSRRTGGLSHLCHPPQFISRPTPSSSSSQRLSNPLLPLPEPNKKPTTTTIVCRVSKRRPLLPTPPSSPSSPPPPIAPSSSTLIISGARGRDPLPQRWHPAGLRGERKKDKGQRFRREEAEEDALKQGVSEEVPNEEAAAVPEDKEGGGISEDKKGGTTSRGEEPGVGADPAEVLDPEPGAVGGGLQVEPEEDLTGSEVPKGDAALVVGEGGSSRHRRGRRGRGRGAGGTSGRM